MSLINTTLKTRKGLLLIVTAPSGTGKTSLVKSLLNQDKHIKLSISYTTRSPRVGEANGIDYHFVSKEDFIKLRDEGEFIEWAEVYGNFYGTSKSWIKDQLAIGQDILLEIDWQGTSQVKKQFPESVGVFIMPPSIAILEQRLRNRGTDSDEVIERRLSTAQDEINHANSKDFDYIVINDEFEQALNDLQSIVRVFRLKNI